jgi:hypothetical protein
LRFKVLFTSSLRTGNHACASRKAGFRGAQAPVAARRPCLLRADVCPISKKFKVTERVGLTFRAEGFNVFNHHNMYVNAVNLDARNFAKGAGPILV